MRFKMQQSELSQFPSKLKFQLVHHLCHLHEWQLKIELCGGVELYYVAKRSKMISPLYSSVDGVLNWMRTSIVDKMAVERRSRELFSRQTAIGLQRLDDYAKAITKESLGQEMSIDQWLQSIVSAFAAGTKAEV